MQITITEQEYQELLRIKREHKFISSRLYNRIKELDKDSKRLNKTTFKTNAGDIVQNIEWVKMRYEISSLLYFVPDEKLEELLK
jgi:predicted CopG family antitoxin